MGDEVVASNTNGKTNSIWVLLLCMLCGLTVGYFIGDLCSQVEVLRWLNFAGDFGLDQPIQLNLGVIWLSVQIKLHVTLAAILGLLLGIFLYKKL